MLSGARPIGYPGMDKPGVAQNPILNKSLKEIREIRRQQVEARRRQTTEVEMRRTIPSPIPPMPVPKPFARTGSCTTDTECERMYGPPQRAPTRQLTRQEIRDFWPIQLPAPVEAPAPARIPQPVPTAPETRTQTQRQTTEVIVSPPSSPSPVGPPQPTRTPQPARTPIRSPNPTTPRTATTTTTVPWLDIIRRIARTLDPGRFGPGLSPGRVELPNPLDPFLDLQPQPQLQPSPVARGNCPPCPSPQKKKKRREQCVQKERVWVAGHYRQKCSAKVRY